MQASQRQVMPVEGSRTARLQMICSVKLSMRSEPWRPNRIKAVLRKSEHRLPFEMHRNPPGGCLWREFQVEQEPSQEWGGRHRGGVLAGLAVVL